MGVKFLEEIKGFYLYFCLKESISKSPCFLGFTAAVNNTTKRQNEAVPK